MELEKIQEVLKDYGLNDKETKVFIANIILGTSKVNEIAKRSKLLRETTYAVLKSLQEKGLVSYVIKSGVKHFSTAPPEKLIDILEEKKKKVITVMKELKELQKTTIDKPVVEFYEGAEGMKTASKDMLRQGNKTILAYANTDILKVMPFYHPSFRLQRKEKKIFMNAIVEDSSEARQVRKFDKKELRKTKFSDKITRGMKCAFYTYEDKVLFLKVSEKEQWGLIIRDKELAELNKRIYDKMWKIAR